MQRGGVFRGWVNKGKGLGSTKYSWDIKCSLENLVSYVVITMDGAR